MVLGYIKTAILFRYRAAKCILHYSVGKKRKNPPFLRREGRVASYQKATDISADNGAVFLFNKTVAVFMVGAASCKQERFGDLPPVNDMVWAVKVSIAFRPIL